MDVFGGRLVVADSAAASENEGRDEWKRGAAGERKEGLHDDVSWRKRAAAWSSPAGAVAIVEAEAVNQPSGI
jgi:hypothetical protein